MRRNRWRIATMEKPKDYYAICWNIAHYCLERGYSYRFADEKLPVHFYIDDKLYEANVIATRPVRSPLNWYVECREVKSLLETSQKSSQYLYKFV